jgi:hypothetical protein
MIFWLFFIASLLSLTAGLSLFLLGNLRYSLASWVLVAALTLMAAQHNGLWRFPWLMRRVLPEQENRRRWLL